MFAAKRKMHFLYTVLYIATHTVGYLKLSHAVFEMAYCSILCTTAGGKTHFVSTECVLVDQMVCTVHLKLFTKRMALFCKISKH